MTYCPSMYGALVRDFNKKSKDDIQVAPSQSEHYLAITNEIIKRLKPTQQQYSGKRAVLVFFESTDELESFYNWPSFARYKDAANRLTEKSAKEPDERDSLVSKATRQGQITLATRSFGRGIDFVVDDEHMVTCGGLHVLLTFFPRDVQEEVQIMGRGARQGEKGSFSMVMRTQQLEDFSGSSAADIDSWKTNGDVYTRLAEVRQTQATDDMKERLEKAHEAMDKHAKAAEALSDFMKGRSSTALSRMLRDYNEIRSTTTSRTLMLLDVTYSMDALIEKTKACIGQFFDRCQMVLDAENIKQGFELQLATYSNYNVTVEQILEKSTWEIKPHNIAQFLKGLRTRGGWGPEAIEVGLMHALVEHQKKPIDQIIVIGDAPHQPIEDIIDKRANGQGHGGGVGSNAYWDAQQPDWAPHGIPKKDALAMLSDIQATKPVPIHCYHIKPRAKTSFEQLAGATGGGTAQPLDINSQAGAQLLTDAVCKQILSTLGGKALEDAYERMKPSFSR